MKLCNKCGREQPETNFSKDCSKPDGLQHACKDCKLAYDKQYDVEHREKVREYKKQYSAEHKEKARAYREEHREYHRQHSKKWKDNNKDAIRKADTLRRKNHPDVMIRKQQNRRAKKAGLARTLTPIQWKSILDAFSGQCAYCGVGGKALEQDHFIPLSAGGEYTHDNIIPACRSCNSLKGTKEFFTWYPTSGYYDKQKEKKIMKFLHYTGATQQLALWV